MPWHPDIAYERPSAAVHDDGSRIPVAPRSPHPQHVAEAVRVVNGLCAQLNEEVAEVE